MPGLYFCASLYHRPCCGQKPFVGPVLKTRPPERIHAALDFRHTGAVRSGLARARSIPPRPPAGTHKVNAEGERIAVLRRDVARMAGVQPQDAIAAVMGNTFLGIVCAAINSAWKQIQFEPVPEEESLESKPV